MSDLRQYLPTVYDNNVHMHTVTDVGELLLDNVVAVSAQERNNLFVPTANVDGVKRYEDILGIIGNEESETLDFRRQRVLNRFSSAPPFTMEYLTEKLDSIIGKDAYNVFMDTANYTLYVESAAENQSWYQEILVTVNRVKPANIVFINTPLVHTGINTSEQIELSSYKWNYVLGTSWSLGNLPFTSMSDLEVIKMAMTKSIGSNLLNDLATFTANDIAKVRINNSHIIADFSTKAATANTAVVEYSVYASDGVNTITLVELLDSNNNVLTSAAVYVPMVADVRLKHTLTVKEA